MFCYILYRTVVVGKKNTNTLLTHARTDRLRRRVIICTRSRSTRRYYTVRVSSGGFCDVGVKRRIFSSSQSKKEIYESRTICIQLYESSRARADKTAARKENVTHKRLYMIISYVAVITIVGERHYHRVRLRKNAYFFYFGRRNVCSGVMTRTMLSAQLRRTML